MNKPTTTRQRGLSRPAVLALVALLSAAGAGGWWWSQRAASAQIAASGAGSTASSGPASAASGPAAGASGASGVGGPGGTSGPGAGGANARRFGGANRVQPVSVMAARKQDVKVVLTAIGNISALNTATVRARVDGELTAIRFKEGQLVKAGALLAEIDPRTYQIALSQVQGQLAKDQSLLKNAQLDLARYKDLLAKDSIARQQVDTQEALVGQLTATVQTDQAQVDNARLQLSYTKITAPITGRLGLKLADLGNIVRAGDAAGIVTITQTQPISVVFAVPEANLAQITRKLKGTDPLTVEAWDREQRNVLATGKVSTTDNAIDAVTGTIKVKAEFANADGTLFPNQFVNIKLQVNTLEDALAVPSTAVQRAPRGAFVYVVKPDSTVTIRGIRVGTTEGDWVSVVTAPGDLAAGDKVVTDGADRLREGAKVEVIASVTRPGGMGAGGPGGGPGAGLGASSGSGAAAGLGRPGGGGQPDGPPRPPGAATAQAGEAAAGGPARAASSGRPGRPTGETSANPPDSAAPAAASRPNNPPQSPPIGAPGAPAASSWIDNLPPEAQDRVRAVMARLPPEEAARVNKMSPDERRAFFQQMRERRQQQMQQNQ
jgi:membrane fusion protein, multidrug efflux system